MRGEAAGRINGQRRQPKKKTAAAGKSGAALRLSERNMFNR